MTTALHGGPESARLSPISKSQFKSTSIWHTYRVPETEGVPEGTVEEGLKTAFWSMIDTGPGTQ